jgi:DNA polymerase sigma
MCTKIVATVAKRGTLTYIPASRVPILKFVESETGIEVDFNCNNVLAMHNSDLIYTYCQVDQRFHIMSVFLKYWAKNVGIIGASNGYLSSYAFNLMVVAFLQQVKPPVLPVLQEKKLRTQKQQTCYYAVPGADIEKNRKGFKFRYHDPNKDTMYLSETDVFFERDLAVIEETYLPKEKNTMTVAELVYEFFSFYLYEYDQMK